MNHVKRSQSQAGDDQNENSEQRATKRIKTYTATDAEIASVLENLGVEHEDTRLKAAADAVRIFSQKPEYAERLLTRLVRGLCSSRKASRPGFFVAVTEVFKVAADQPELLVQNGSNGLVKYLLEQIDASTQPGPAPTNQEKKEYLIGRLTACSAIVHSNIAFQESIDEIHLKTLLRTVWEIQDQAPELVEQCGKFYVDIVAIAGGVQNRAKPIEATLRFLAEKSALKTPEGLALWIEASQVDLDIHFPEHIWRGKNPLSKKEVSTIKKVLCSNAADANINDQVQALNAVGGRRRDTPHFVWHVLLQRLFSGGQSAPEHENSGSSRSLFKKLWTSCVDEFYFASPSSSERKAVGFRIFSLVLTEGPTWACKIALSPNLLNCFLNQNNKSERFLHQSAKSVLQILKSRVATNAELTSTLCSYLIPTEILLYPETVMRAKPVILEVFHSSSEDVAGAIVDHFILTLQNSLKRNPATRYERQKHDASIKILADQLLTFCRVDARSSANMSTIPMSWRVKLLTGLARCICLKNMSKEDESLDMHTPSNQIHDVLETRLWSCLREIWSRAKTGKLEVLESVCNDLSMSKQEHLSALAGNDEAWQKMQDSSEVLSHIKKTEQDDHSTTPKAATTTALQLLLNLTQLQVYCGEQDAVDILKELCQFYEETGGNDISVNTGSNTLVDVLLSFISRPITSYRSIAEQAFTALSSEISLADLDPLLRVLEQDESIAGQRELFDQKVDTESNSENEEQSRLDEASNDRDDPNSKDSGTESDGSKNESDEDDSGDEEEGADEADEALNNSLAELLQIGQFNPNSERQDEVDNEESSDESMNDEQMEALGMDEKLSKIFSDRKSQQQKSGKVSDNKKKKEQKEAKQNIVNFKSRVLGLLSIYMRNHHSSPDTIGILVPLLHLIETTRSTQISKKASEVIDTYCKAAKGKGMALQAAATDVWDTLAQVHEHALNFASKQHAYASSKSSLFLARLLILQQQERAMDKLIQLYAETHSRRFKEGSKLPASFWTDFVNWSVSINENKS